MGEYENEGTRGWEGGRKKWPEGRMRGGEEKKEFDRVAMEKMLAAVHFPPRTSADNVHILLPLPSRIYTSLGFFFLTQT